MTIIGTAIDNKEHLQLLKYPTVMTKHGLMQFIISGDQVPIHDTERTSGVYILGKPRMGKSWLIINMILQDHKQKKGIFFIDPHGEAIDQLVTRANSALRPFTIFDFEDDSATLTSAWRGNRPACYSR